MSQTIKCDLCKEEIEGTDNNNPVEMSNPVDSTMRELEIYIYIGWYGSGDSYYDLCYGCFRRVIQNLAASLGETHPRERPATGPKPKHLR